MTIPNYPPTMMKKKPDKENNYSPIKVRTDEKPVTPLESISTALWVIAGIQILSIIILLLQLMMSWSI